MCGIAAIYAYGATAAAVDAQELETITDSMTARGPDAKGVWISPDRRVGLGSRRLAIIDLTPEGTQPMTDVERELQIIFNGEIYNHQELRTRLERTGARFHSRSDTEVLLQLYRREGPSMVELLRGMFAMVIWDRRVEELFIARDPYGIKPLYYSDAGQTVRIASQVKALWAGGRVSRTRDAAGVCGFLMMGSVPEPFTIAESIRSVEAGSTFSFSGKGRSEVKRPWSIARVFQSANARRPVARLTLPEILLSERVTESIENHLVSDVPVGAFLSAGIDSTTIAALVSRADRAPLRTITLSFQEFRGEKNDEAPLAERFARSIGAEHTTRTITRDEFLQDMPRFFTAMDQPTIDGVNTWFVSKAATEQGLKVALSGLGGDELFGSYPSFRQIPRMVRASRFAVARSLMRIAARGNPKSSAVSELTRTYAGGYFLQRGLYLPEELPALIGAETTEEGVRKLQLLDHIGSRLDPDPITPFGRIATLEATLYMRNQLLRDTDWASMAHSLEVRTPLVDAFLLRQLSPLLLEYGSRSKQVFARSTQPPLPDWLRKRRKTGFSVPLKAWMNLPPDGTTTHVRSWAKIVLERFA